jgi:chromosome segregation ATPase
VDKIVKNFLEKISVFQRKFCGKIKVLIRSLIKNLGPGLLSPSENVPESGVKSFFSKIFDKILEPISRWAINTILQRSEYLDEAARRIESNVGILTKIHSQTSESINAIAGDVNGISGITNDISHQVENVDKAADELKAAFSRERMENEKLIEELKRQVEEAGKKAEEAEAKEKIMRENVRSMIDISRDSNENLRGKLDEFTRIHEEIKNNVEQQKANSDQISSIIEGSNNFFKKIQESLDGSSKILKNIDFSDKHVAEKISEATKLQQEAMNTLFSFQKYILTSLSNLQKQMAEQVRQMENHIRNDEQKLGEMQKELKNSEADLNAKRDELDKITGEIEKAEAESKSFFNILNPVRFLYPKNKNIDQLKANQASAQNLASEAETKYNNLQNEVSNLRNQISGLNAAIEKAKGHCDDVKNNHEQEGVIIEEIEKDANDISSVFSVIPLHNDASSAALVVGATVMTAGVIVAGSPVALAAATFAAAAAAYGGMKYISSRIAALSS